MTVEEAQQCWEELLDRVAAGDDIVVGGVARFIPVALDDPIRTELGDREATEQRL